MRKIILQQYLPGADSCAARKKDDAPFRLRASLM
jgi:hypothetical protein